MQWSRTDLRPILVPVLVVLVVAMLLGFLGYKFSFRRFMDQMRLGADKKGPPGAEREVTLVLTDVQVRACDQNASKSYAKQS